MSVKNKICIPSGLQKITSTFNSEQSVINKVLRSRICRKEWSCMWKKERCQRKRKKCTTYWPIMRTQSYSIGRELLMCSPAWCLWQFHSLSILRLSNESDFRDIIEYLSHQHHAIQLSPELTFKVGVLLVHPNAKVTFYVVEKFSGCFSAWKENEERNR